MKSPFTTVKIVRTQAGVLVVPAAFAARLQKKEGKAAGRGLASTLAPYEEAVEIVKVDGFPALYFPASEGAAGFLSVWEKPGQAGLYLDYGSGDEENAEGKAFLEANENKFFTERLGTVEFGDEKLVAIDPLDPSGPKGPLAGRLKDAFTLPAGKYLVEKGLIDGVGGRLKVLRLTRLSAKDKTVSRKAKK